jgi:ABC-2 type transport system permease protein
MMPTILLSGFIFPIESMPRPLQLISHILPGKWFLIILKNVMLKGVGFAYVWKETAILSGMLLLLLAAGIRNFKIRLA